MREGGNIVFHDVGISVGNCLLVNPIGVVTLGESHLCTSLDASFPNGIGKHQLGGIEAALRSRLAFDEVIFYQAFFHVFAVSVDGVFHKVEVEVDAEFANSAAVVRVGEDAERFAFLAGLLAVKMVKEDIVFEDILIVNDLVLAAEIMRKVGTDTYRMIVGDLPVDTSGIYQLVILPCHGVWALLTEHFCGVGNLLQSAVLAIVHVPIVN